MFTGHKGLAFYTLIHQRQPLTRVRNLVAGGAEVVHPAAAGGLFSKRLGSMLRLRVQSSGNPCAGGQQVPRLPQSFLSQHAREVETRGS
jgi:hypothetical protein